MLTPGLDVKSRLVPPGAREATLERADALTAYAIAIAGRLGWTFFLIAMLPAALYGRSVVSADGAALACTMVITALCVRASNSME